MAEAASASYVRCRNCGTYVPTSEAHSHYYCSDECTVQYSSCLNCGKHFKRPVSGNVLYCSSECAAVYDVPISPRIGAILKEAS